MSEPVSVPATAGAWEVDPEGAIFPRAEVTAVVAAHGIPGVRLVLLEPNATDGRAVGVFTANGIRCLLAVLQRKLALIDAPYLPAAARS